MTCTCPGNPDGIHQCASCARTLSVALMCVADFHHDLVTSVRTKQTRYDTTGKPSVGKTIPAPLDLRFASPTDTGQRLADETHATLAAWARVVMDERPEIPGDHCGHPCIHLTCNNIRRNRWPNDTVRSMAYYLDRQHAWIRGRDWAPDLLDETRDLEKRLRKFVNPPPARWPAGKCECGTDLSAKVGARIIRCRTCALEWDAAELRDYLLTRASDELVTATVAATALVAWTDYDGTPDRLVKRIGEWRDRGLLDVADVTSLSGRDRHLYRFGDVQDVVLERLVQHARRVGS